MPLSRLGPALAPREPEFRMLAPFNHRVLPQGVLLSNDFGRFELLSPADFERFAAGRLRPGEPLWARLQEGGFLREHLDFDALISGFRRARAQLFEGPSLHIAVLTLRCDHKCGYCHSSVLGPDRRDLDMSPETARRVVDLAFRSPSPRLTLEFQGGEPLLNWPVLRYMVAYAKLKNRFERRDLRLALVSNLSRMDPEKLAWVAEEGVGLCTSLDGPEALHNKNRAFTRGNSHALARHWLSEFRRLYPDGPGRPYRRPCALMTATRHSLPYAREIVDEYAAAGLDGIHLRPVNPIGFAGRAWPAIGVEPEEYAAFYGRALDRVLELNYEGTLLVERGTLMLLRKILAGEDPGYTDLRSPSGGGLGALAYSPDGGVYSSDEGRMLAQDGDLTFRLGGVDQGWEELVGSAANRACALATTMEGAQPLCAQCAYKPWCGLCPAYNKTVQGGLAGQMPSNGRCRTWMGVFDALFERLADPRARAVFEGWLALSRTAGAVPMETLA